MNPMTDERLNQIPWDAKQEITRLRAELADTKDSLDAAARCVASMTTELTECQRQAAAMRAAIKPVLDEADQRDDWRCTNPEWNLDAHIQMTLSVGDLRKLLSAYEAAKGKE